MKFWRITSPARNGDYDYTFLNGALSHPHGMPGVKCDVCGATWGGSRILMCEAPEVVRKRKPGDVWPLPLEQFDALRVLAEAQLGPDSPRLLPGDEFQPAVLDVPSRPRSDFLWSSLGSLVVSARIRDILVQMCHESIGWAQVNLGKIGKREAHLPAPIPPSGEPEDLFSEAKPLLDRSQVGPYFEVTPIEECGWPPGGAPTSVCGGCLRPSIDSDTRDLKFSERMWRGAPIFYLATTLWIIVTDDLKCKIQAAKPTNVAFEEA